jgi:hypothetical protein
MRHLASAGAPKGVLMNTTGSGRLIEALTAVQAGLLTVGGGVSHRFFRIFRGTIRTLGDNSGVDEKLLRGHTFSSNGKPAVANNRSN